METLEVCGTLLAWHSDMGVMPPYLRIEGQAAAEISVHELHRRITSGKRRGFGSVKVEARIGDSTWLTSVFPQGYGWFLPIKAAVRRAQYLERGRQVQVELTLL